MGLVAHSHSACSRFDHKSDCIIPVRHCEHVSEVRTLPTTYLKVLKVVHQQL